MEYILKNAEKITIRKPTLDDAERIVSIIATADTESLFLARNPGEFDTTPDQERQMIEQVLQSKTCAWFVAEYKGTIVGICSVSQVASLQRFRHRAEMSLLVLEEYCGIGIGRYMIEECLEWCQEHEFTQIELDVVTTNTWAFALYQNCGFKIVGILPNAMRYPDGRTVDEYKMVRFLV